MPKAIELLYQGRHEELWQMCCGYLNCDIDRFMNIQNRLLLGQIEYLNRSKIGRKIMGGARPQTVEEFRQQVPLTSYDAYCPELVEKREDILPERPSLWVHTSGRSGEYSCKWVPLSPSFINELSPIIYGIGMLSACNKWGDTSPLIEKPNIIYTVAPRPYMSGALASLLQDQTPSYYFPTLSEAENMPFEERIKFGFDKALSNGLDFFFGLSSVLSAVGNKFNQSVDETDILPLLSRPKALWRLTRGMVKSRLAGRHMLPKDLWRVKGIITSGLDSSVYKEKIKEFWGRYPLDIYANTEGGIIATQTWDYDGMTFIPNLNFLEFIPETEHFKWQLDHDYQPKTVLLNEVQAGECYEIVISNFHGGALMRYRVGDMIRITSLRNENLGIGIPQMAFERRADDLLDFVVIRLTEKTIWQAIENVGVDYEDWVAFKNPGEPILHILLETGGEKRFNESWLEMAIYEEILRAENDSYTSSRAHDDLADMIKFRIKVTLLPKGAFANYTASRRSEGADLAHLKPPQVNPPQRVIAALLSATELTTKPILRAKQGIPSVPVG